MTEKKYKVGMYGGKFCPMHLGHRFVLERAMRECEELHVFMFYNTPEETESRSKWFTDPVYLTKKSIYLIMAFVGLYNWWKLSKERNPENE